MIMIKKYIKIKFDLDDDLPLNKTIEIHNVLIAVRDIFMKITNIIHKFFLDACLYKLQTQTQKLKSHDKETKTVICKTKCFYILLAFLLITIDY